jgi:hypothetical protein
VDLSDKRLRGAQNRDLRLSANPRTRASARISKGFQRLSAYGRLSGVSQPSEGNHRRRVLGARPRKWEHLYKTIPQEKRKDSSAGQAMAYINALFSLEREFADLTPQERYEKRLEKSKPIADAFFAWAESLKALPKGPLGQPVIYMLSQRGYLYNIFLDGRLEISNNRAERSVKPFVIGRKNWLFANTPDGANASSVMYSIIETAKENGLHPQRYIEFLLKVLPDSTTGDLENLLPWSQELTDYCRA